MPINLRRNSRVIAFLLLILQLGVIAHRIEHYVAPAQMESGEDACVAFSPIIDPPALPALVTPPVGIAYFVKFWTAREAIVEQPADRLGFQAHAPPV